MKLQRNQLIAIVAIFSSALLAGCHASGGATATGAGVVPFFQLENGLALKGYDPVAYFSEGKPVEGRGEFEAEWQDSKWRFASALNREMFLRAPEKYAPQYGGYCAWAVSHGYTAKGDPEAWKIVEGKLYLNYNQDVKAKWEQDIPAFISKGDENWTSFQKARPEHKGEGSN
jgi:hypothetical protein